MLIVTRPAGWQTSTYHRQKTFAHVGLKWLYLLHVILRRRLLHLVKTIIDFVPKSKKNIPNVLIQWCCCPATAATRNAHA